jgi:hypothetical protein
MSGPYLSQIEGPTRPGLSLRCSERSFPVERIRDGTEGYVPIHICVVLALLPHYVQMEGDITSEYASEASSFPASGI